MTERPEATTQADTTSGAGLEPGTVIDGREVIRCLGRGGMGAVYQTRHLKMDRLEAVKIMHPRFVADPEFLQRFKREGKSVAALNHPNVVSVYAYGVFGGIPYLAMEYLEGPSLRELLRRAGRLRESIAVPIILDICAGLQHAHDTGIMHRDLKPDNVIVTHTQEGQKAKVVDFGLSKACLDAQRLTLTGEVVGDPRYMSPEQTQGKKLDHRSDIYSLGCLMYEVLTGIPPFDAENSVALMYMRLQNEPPRFPADLDVPPAYEEIVMRAMALDKRHRFASASELAEEVTNALNDNYVPKPKPLERTPDPETEESQSDVPAFQASAKGLGTTSSWKWTPPNKQTVFFLGAGIATAIAIAVAIPALIGSLPSAKITQDKTTHRSPPAKASLQQPEEKTSMPKIISSQDQSTLNQASQKTQKGWCFLQKSEQSGIWHVYLTESGQMSINDAMGVTMVTKAPLWNLALYNSKTKVYYLWTMNDWQMHSQQNPKYKNRTKYVSKPAGRRGSQGIIAGMRATQYFVDAPINGGARQAEVWVADDVRIPPELSLHNERIYDSSLGGNGAFPLRFSYIDESGKKTMVMNTIAGRQEVIPMASFNYPTHFKRVDNELAVFLDDKDRKIMADILDDDDDPELTSLLGKRRTNP